MLLVFEFKEKEVELEVAIKKHKSLETKIENLQKLNSAAHDQDDKVENLEAVVEEMKGCLASSREAQDSAWQQVCDSLCSTSL